MANQLAEKCINDFCRIFPLETPFLGPSRLLSADREYRRDRAVAFAASASEIDWKKHDITYDLLNASTK